MKIKMKKGVGGMPLVWVLMINIVTILCVPESGGEWRGSWSRKASEGAERVAEKACSGHGRAYLDGLVLYGDFPVCECNSCYAAPNCSHFLPNCSANADGGDPYFLEPFWMEHAESSAILVSGWHRMSYSYEEGSFMSQVLEMQIRKLHETVGNAVTRGKYIVFGAGSTQLFGAAIYALSLHNSSSLSPAQVVATVPYFRLYREQTQLVNSVNYRFGGDTWSWKNKSDENTKFIEFVTSPNNPDGKLNEAVLHGPNVKHIYDRAYYWPHYTPIPSPADEALMLFTLSKLTGHAGTRFGWAIVKDKEVYEKMLMYVRLNSLGLSKDAQLRALKLLNVVIKEEAGRGIFEFGYNTMRDRWIRLRRILSLSNRFSLQHIQPQYCSFFQTVREFSPAYAWLKCEREEERDCYSILKASGINGRQGHVFEEEDRYMRLSIIRSQDDFEILIHKLTKLVDQEHQDYSVTKSLMTRAIDSQLILIQNPDIADCF